MATNSANCHALSNSACLRVCDVKFNIKNQMCSKAFGESCDMNRRHFQGLFILFILWSLLHELWLFLELFELHHSMLKGKAV